MTFKNPVATFLFFFFHESPFQFVRRVIHDWEMRKRLNGGGGGHGNAATLASGEGDDYILPHDDDRLIAGCDNVTFCPDAGWIELGGEG